MIDMRFFLPAADLRSWISSYYILDFTVSEFTDIVQAEQANIRFALSGTFHLSLGDRSGRYDGATLFGHRVLPMRMQAKGPGRVFGAGLLPTGFEALIGMPADRMTDLIVPLSEVIGSAADQAQMRFPRGGGGRGCRFGRRGGTVSFVRSERHANRVGVCSSACRKPG